MIRITSKPKELETARVWAGYSQRGLSQKAGINPSTLNHAERKAKQVWPQTAKAIASALNTEVSQLFVIEQEAQE